MEFNVTQWNLMGIDQWELPFITLNVFDGMYVYLVD